MNYIGSKKRLLGAIKDVVARVVGADSVETFFEPFAGTGVVGRFFREAGYSVVSNDIQYYSFVLNRHYVGSSGDLGFRGLAVSEVWLQSVPVSERPHAVCRFLNSLPGERGFVAQNFSESGSADRLYFSAENGARIDSVRLAIERWQSEKLLSEDEYYFLLASLVEAVDASANTASVYGAFLKKLKKKALQPLVLLPAKVPEASAFRHQIFNEDANLLAPRVSVDVAYIDPPYNQRQYATNYHVLETVARYDEPILRGKTGLRPSAEQLSRYCSRREAGEAFSDLISKIQARYIFVSYNDEGLLSEADIRSMMEKRGEYGVIKIPYSRFKADSSRGYKKTETVEYIHYVKCSEPKRIVNSDLFPEGLASNIGYPPARKAAN